MDVRCPHDRIPLPRARLFGAQKGVYYWGVERLVGARSMKICSAIAPISEK